MKRTAIGVDLGGTHLRAARVGWDGAVGESRSRALSHPHDGEWILDALSEEIAALVAEGVVAVGIGAAGPLDHVTGRMYAPPNIPGLKNRAVADAVRARCGLPCFLENDANAAAFGEFSAGVGASTEVFVALTLGTGVGGGIVLGGELFRGPDGAAAELGHITVLPDGLPCNCGNRGCLEQYASATATARRYQEASRANGPAGGGPDTLEIFNRARRGDSLARSALFETGKWLGIGTASLINIFNPDVIAVLGGLAGAWEFIEPSLSEEVGRRAVSPSRDRVKILPGRLGGDAGLVGAALLALRRLPSTETSPENS